MMKIKKIFSIALFSLVAGCFLSTPVAFADHCDGLSSPVAIDNCNAQHAAADGDSADSTAYKFNGRNQDVGINDLVIEILKFLSIAVGIAVVAGITVGGITYSTSQGNPSQTQKGIKIIGNSVLGLVLYFLMFAIVNFLIPGGILK